MYINLNVEILNKIQGLSCGILKLIADYVLMIFMSIGAKDMRYWIMIMDCALYESPYI